MDLARLLSMMNNLEVDSGDESEDMPPRLSPDLPSDQLRSRMEELKKWHKRQNDLPPCAAPPSNRALIQSQRLRSRSEQESGQIWQTFVGSPKNHSSKPLEELTTVSISSMFLHKVHKGQYLLCRIVAPFVRLLASQTVVEDPSGAVVDLSIYNFPATGPGTLHKKIDSLFPVGTIMAIREPMFKLGTQGGNPFIRVDSISDIVILDEHDSICSNVNWGFPLNSPLPSTSVDNLKEIGNKHFQRGDWLLAVFAYSRGLRLDKDAFLLRLNRAEAYLRLSYYSAALFDAETVMSSNLIDSKSRWKALWRAAKALYFQGNYSAARERFEESRKFEGDVDESKEWFQRICQREEELKHGRFDWARIFRESVKAPHIQHIAEFRGPVEVRSLPDRGGGRGVIATAAIEVGQILVVGKPFASVYPSDLPGKERLLSFNLVTGTVDDACHTVLISKVMEQLWGNPESHGALFNLYAGAEYSSPAELPESHSFSSSGIQFPFKSAVDIDVMRLEAIVSCNAFSPIPIEASLHLGGAERLSQQTETPSALYLFASMFNHSCLPNAMWFCFGDVMVISAARTIAEGEEIYIPYVTPSGSFKERQDGLRKHLPDECRCELCAQDRADGVSNCQRREQLMEKIKSASTTQQYRRLLTQIEETYSSSRGNIRPELFFSKHGLGEMLRSNLKQSHAQLSKSTFRSRMKETIELDLAALKNIGVAVQDQPSGLPISTDCFPSFLSRESLAAYYLSIAVNYLNLEDNSRAVSWVKAAEWVVRAGFGGDKSFFYLLLGKLLDKMKIRDFVDSVL
ncbi:hypothetical protein D9758_002497 [Tetrapyrgos nigripes]|uniref:SET domain-containing protein n=1 Tax=Tetrapyrgos nigripes TaxID=182062 RepID=A0A8H5GQX0_9AGAR|nr:hypothetical protein D9758_002497 [Tetrapyrgos nigripes]